MIIHKRTDLQKYSTFGLRARANYLIELSDDDDLSDLSEFITDMKLPSMTLGGGSNLIFCADYPGVIIKNTSSDMSKVTKNRVTVSSGANWDDFVRWTIDQDLSGLETLSGIPGTVGGAVALNAGAYGGAVKDTLESIRVYDVYNRKFHSFTRSELSYGHRTSILRQKRGNDWLIVDATFALYTKLVISSHPKILALNSTDRSASTALRASVLKLRSHMPDLATHNYSGSFFLNPNIPNKFASELRQQFPNIMMRPFDGTHEQIAAGWLIEQVGLKGTHFDNFSFYKSHANLVINQGTDTTGKDLAELINHVQKLVYEKFKVHIVPEPLLVGEEYWQGILSTAYVKLYLKG